mgnify:CR=1 FL=1
MIDGANLNKLLDTLPSNHYITIRKRGGLSLEIWDCNGDRLLAHMLNVISDLTFNEIIEKYPARHGIMKIETPKETAIRKYKDAMRMLKCLDK